MRDLEGLEFHTMIFFGLDDQSWWSLKKTAPEELSAFFVALTRAEHRAFFTLSKWRGRPFYWIEELLEPAGLVRVEGEEATGDAKRILLLGRSAQILLREELLDRNGDTPPSSTR